VRIKLLEYCAALDGNITEFDNETGSSPRDESGLSHRQRCKGFKTEGILMGRE